MQVINFEGLEQLEFRGTEAYNSLRTNIQFCGSDIKTICFTSCTPNEGKSIVSFRLATSMAESGKKVLFIDADLRKSVLIGRLRIDKGIVGLTHYLSGMKELNEVVYSSNIDNFDIIFAGPVPPNPSELLSSNSFVKLIESMKEKYDYVIIDTPPLGLVIDSANVAKYCDGTIIVIESNNVSHKFVTKIVKQLGAGNCRILGAILNKVPQKNKSYYGGYYGEYSS